MVKLVASAFVLMALVACQHGRAKTEPKCDLQQLAIDAALGDAQAQYNLGVEFHRGESIPQDYSKAAAMWQLAGKNGVVESFNNLGYLTYHGKGVQQDYAEGVRLWRIAAEQGFGESQIHIGQAYYGAEYLEQNYSEAYAWAKAGTHYARLLEDRELGKSIVEMGEKLIAESQKKLSEEQLENAEKLAAEYIQKFGPK